jgi:hypothetical protein
MARSLGLYTSFVVVAAAAAACGGQSAPPAQTAAAGPSASAPAPKNSIEQTPGATPGSASAAPAEPPKPAAPAPVAKWTGLAHPESVLYDADGDRYIVSNINGSPFDKDNNGFLSILSADGTIANLKWIEGGKNKVKLDAPKGSAIYKGVLYVADLTVVRTFDLKTGAQKADIAIPGTVFLNDVAAGPDGKIYVSDSSFKMSKTGAFESSGTDAVYVIDKGKAKALAKSPDLHAPNGLLWTDKGLVVVSNGAPEAFRLDDKGAKQDITKTPAAGLDGLLPLGDSLVVTSWEASAVLRGKLGGTFEVVIPDQKSPADIGYDTKRGRLLLPHLMEDTVEAYELK